MSNIILIIKMTYETSSNRKPNILMRENKTEFKIRAKKIGIINAISTKRGNHIKSKYFRFSNFKYLQF